MYTSYNSVCGLFVFSYLSCTSCSAVLSPLLVLSSECRSFWVGDFYCYYDDKVILCLSEVLTELQMMFSQWTMANLNLPMSDEILNVARRYIW